MLTSYNWLKQFITLDWDSRRTGDLLTSLGLEVEGISSFESIQGGLKGVVVGEVLSCIKHPNADKLVVLQVDLGDEQRQFCAGLKGYYEPDQLVGRNIIVVTNLAPRMMRGMESQGMLLAAVTPGEAQVVLLTTAEDIPPGTPVS